MPAPNLHSAQNGPWADFGVAGLGLAITAFVRLPLAEQDTAERAAAASLPAGIDQVIVLATAAADFYGMARPAAAAVMARRLTRGADPAQQPGSRIN